MTVNRIIATTCQAAATSVGVLFWWLILRDVVSALVAYLVTYHVIFKGKELAQVMNVEETKIRK